MILVKTPRVLFKNTEANAEVRGEPLVTEYVTDVDEDPELGAGKWYIVPLKKGHKDRYFECQVLACCFS